VSTPLWSYIHDALTREQAALAEVAELTQEANKLALQVTQLCDERDELRADRERLEFIAAECGGDGQLIWKFFGVCAVILECKDEQDLRAAIDAARAKP